MNIYNQYEKIWIELIKEVEDLEKRISNYLQYPENENKDNLQNDYKQLKNKFKNIAHEVGLTKYDKFIDDNKFTTFQSNVREAAAFGFTAKTNSIVNMEMFYSVEEANSKINKCIIFEDNKIKFE